MAASPLGALTPALPDARTWILEGRLKSVWNLRMRFETLRIRSALVARSRIGPNVSPAVLWTCGGTQAVASGGRGLSEGHVRVGSLCRGRRVTHVMPGPLERRSCIILSTHVR